MIRPWLCSIMCLGTSAAALPAQIPDSIFKGAKGSDSLFFFESPIRLDLTLIAQSARPDFQPAHPDTSLIREFYDEDHGATWIPYEAPLPSFLPARHYWVLGDSGATEVYPRTTTWRGATFGSASDSSYSTGTSPALVRLRYPVPTQRPRPASAGSSVGTGPASTAIPVRTADQTFRTSRSPRDGTARFRCGAAAGSRRVLSTSSALTAESTSASRKTRRGASWQSRVAPGGCWNGWVAVSGER
jgi:hypothetical protein